MSGWSAGERPAHLRPVAILGNEPPPRASSSESSSRSPAVGARCEQCGDLLAHFGNNAIRGRPGERIVDCRTCGRRNVFYSAAWLDSDKGGTK